MRLIKIKENILTMIKKVGNQSREIKKKHSKEETNRNSEAENHNHLTKNVTS